MSSYAVLWSEPPAGIEAGKLELDPAGLRFEGRNGHDGPVHRVGYGEIRGVRIGRRPDERLGGKPALVLELAAGGPLRIGSVAGLGTVVELAERLLPLTGRP